MRYGDLLFPAASLAAALRHYGISFKDVEIVPGKHLSFDLLKPDEHGRTSISIPINTKGQMQVNWAGLWENQSNYMQDFRHYPYNVVKSFQEIEYSNYVLAKFKSIVNLSFDGNAKEAVKPALGFIDAPRKMIVEAYKTVMMRGVIEKWIIDNPNGTAKEFKKVPPFVFNEIKNNNIIANAFLDSTRSDKPTLDELLSNDSLLLDYGIKDYQFSSVNQLESDLENAGIKNYPPLIQIQRNFQIISNLNQNQMIDEQRPLYFFFDPKAPRLAAGKGENRKLIVPFEFVGKKMFYGLTAAGTSDLNPMPFEARYPMVGLHANALNTILDNKIINEISKEQVALIIFIIALLLAFGVPALSAALGGLVTAIIVGLYAWLSFWLFSTQHIWLDMVGPLSTLAIGYLGITVYNYIQEEKNKNFLKESFGTYVSPELIDQMYESGEEPSLEAKGYHTAFFTDIQSFSAFSEKLTASELVALLNQYLTDMTDVLLENNGTLDKYIGDAIVAFYGAPIDVDDHEYWAAKLQLRCRTSLPSCVKVGREKVTAGQKLSTTCRTE